jgi:hypothetical protein
LPNLQVTADVYESGPYFILDLDTVEFNIGTAGGQPLDEAHWQVSVYPLSANFPLPGPRSSGQPMVGTGRHRISRTALHGLQRHALALEGHRSPIYAATGSHPSPVGEESMAGVTILYDRFGRILAIGPEDGDQPVPGRGDGVARISLPGELESLAPDELASNFSHRPRNKPVARGSLPGPS